MLWAILVALALWLASPTALAEFSLNDWRYSKHISIPAEVTEGELLELPVDEEVFAGAAAGLADLRIIRDEVQEVAYQLVVEKGESQRQSVTVDIQDLGVVPGQHTSFVAVLKGDGTLHNELEILTTSHNFQREVKIEGSNDGDVWSVLQESTQIFDFTPEEREFTAGNTAVRYPESTVRYLRVIIVNGPDEPLNVTGASVFSFEEKEPRQDRYPSAIVERSDDTGDGRSISVIDLGSEGFPSSRLIIQTPDVNFYREVTLDGSNDQIGWVRLTGVGTVYAYDTPKFVGSRLAVDYPESTYRYLRLAIANEDNPPLMVANVRVFGVARRLLFTASPGTSYNLFYGNPDARAPSYDLDRILPYLETEGLPQGVLDRQQENPSFMAPQRPMSERYPWLFPVAVGGAAVVVAILLFGVLRRARSLLPPAA